MDDEDVPGRAVSALAGHGRSHRMTIVVVENDGTTEAANAIIRTWRGFFFRLKLWRGDHSTRIRHHLRFRSSLLTQNERYWRSWQRT